MWMGCPERGGIQHIRSLWPPALDTRFQLLVAPEFNIWPLMWPLRMWLPDSGCLLNLLRETEQIGAIGLLPRLLSALHGRKMQKQGGTATPMAGIDKESSYGPDGIEYRLSALLKLLHLGLVRWLRGERHLLWSLLTSSHSGQELNKS